MNYKKIMAHIIAALLGLSNIKNFLVQIDRE